MTATLPSVAPTRECLDFGVMYPQLCGADTFRREYYALAAATGGQQISVCVADFREVFAPLTDAVTRIRVPCAIDIGPVFQPDSVTVTA